MNNSEMTQELVLMDSKRVNRTIHRIAFEIIENVSSTSEIIFAGLNNRGFTVASKVRDVICNNSKIKPKLVQIFEDDDTELNVSVSNSVVIVFDDVIFSGRTMLRAINKIFIKGEPSILMICALVDRGHRKFPLTCQFTGIHYPTKLREHVRVEVSENKDSIQVILET